MPPRCPPRWRIRRTDEHQIQAAVPPWREVAGLRDVLAHAYFRVDLALIWAIVQTDMPVLDAAVRRLVTAHDGSRPP